MEERKEDSYKKREGKRGNTDGRMKRKRVDDKGKRS